MTAAFPLSGSLPRQLVWRSARLFTRPASTTPLLRVTCRCGADNDRTSCRTDYLKAASILGKARTYATAVTKPASRPKGHTGRSPAKRTAATKTKPAKKRAAKKKAVKKTKPKAKKPPSKSALLKKARKQQSDLKAAALLDTPKQLPQTAYTVVFSEEAKKGGNVAANAGAASSRYKGLTSEERERYNQEANSNKEKNDAAYKRWVEGHSPLEIRLANNARRQLNKKAKASGKKKTYTMIKDDRIVKLPLNAYAFFFKERHASGDFKGMAVAESGKLVGREWKELAASEKKTYTDKAAEDKARYLEEYKTVYGEDAPLTKRKST